MRTTAKLQPYYGIDGKLLDSTATADHNIERQKQIDRGFLSASTLSRVGDDLEESYKSATAFGVSGGEGTSLEDMMDGLVERSVGAQRRIAARRILRLDQAKSAQNRETAVLMAHLSKVRKISSCGPQAPKAAHANPADTAMAELKTGSNYKIDPTTLTEEDNPEDQRFTFGAKVLTPVGKIIRAIKTINLLLKATTTNIEHNRKQQQKYLTYTDITPEEELLEFRSQEIMELSFSVSDFRMRRKDEFSQEAVSIMQMHKSLRSPDHINMVVQALVSTVEEFGEYPKNIQYSLIQHGWYERHGNKQVIIRQGHAAQNFYFIISGLTQVMVALKNSSGDSIGKTVAFLNKGNSFGDMAIMYGGNRNATVVSMGPVELLSVARGNFIDIFMAANDSNSEPSHIKALRSIPALHNWPIDRIPHNNPRKCLFTFFRRGTVLCYDSNNCEWIYIVCSGTCRIIKGLQQTEMKRFQIRPTALGPVRGGYRLIRPFPDKGKKVYVELGILKPGDIFGLEAVAFEQLGATDSVMFVADGAECVAINKAFFLKHVTESYMRKLRFEIQPFPSESELGDKLQTYTDWRSFKKSLLLQTMNEIK